MLHKKKWYGTKEVGVLQDRLPKLNNKVHSEVKGEGSGASSG